ncbi:LysM-like peptidoglycan-binding domain-containing protein [Otariodibacter oris]|uniref:Opacity associated protein n=1 Tax=Otariodibacter oris TaxID=1032623 RepID=A0A420XFB9_9PAST|nr:LysM-like peptidoglycan-binding domain-containing protein [Otariodibacter oris]QGM81623.1 hypothetical protein A6A10_09535 [Otariodibacter oris]RKR71235.1 opacity associated protein [Otariodibacter oris]
MLKENNQTPSTTTETVTSKTTGFAFPPVSENETQPHTEQPDLTTDPRLTTSTPEESLEKENTAEQNIPPTLGAERVIPQTSSANNKNKQVPNDAKIPPKYRRLFIVILIILALLLVFFLLKPQTPETVESLQDQGTSLPIEFRPVDEEEARRAEEEAKALQITQQQQQTINRENTQLNDSSNAQEITLNTDNDNAINTQDKESISQTSTVSNSSTSIPNDHVNVTPAPVQKPSLDSGSVIYREEASVPSRSSQRTISRGVSQTSQAQANVRKSSQTQSQTQQRNTRSQQTVQTRNKSTNTAASSTTTSTALSPEIVSVKTLIVPKGVSLMQMFRDNDLNISDVNAMNKENDILSHLHVGEEITVYLDKNNRVVEMQIASAGRFVRQTDGSYKYLANYK